jgi:putative Holliday junction resolvase
VIGPGATRERPSRRSSRRRYTACPMRILGLDLGKRRIGLAISDAEGLFAFPDSVLPSAGLKKDVAAIARIVTEREIGRVVVGLPKHMDGRKGPEAKAAEAFARALQQKTGLPVETLDERWTSIEAERVLRAQGKTAKQAKQHVDSVAAAIILRTYLELRSRQAE